MEHPVKEIKTVIRHLTQGTPDQQHDAVYRYFTPGATFQHPFCRVPSFKKLHVPGAGDFDSRALIVAIYKWIMSPKIELDIKSTVFDQRTNLLYVKISQTFSVWFIPFYRAPVSLLTVLTLVPTHPPSNGAADANAHASASANKSPSPTSSTPPVQDAAQEKLHAVQEGAEPSYASVASGDARPENSRRGSSTSSTTPTTRPQTRYYIQKQEDLYQVNEFLKFVSMAPGAAVCGFLQLIATLFCLAAALLLGPVAKAAWPGVAGTGKEGLGEGKKK